LKIIPAEVAAIGRRYFKLRFAVVVPQPTTDLAGSDCSDSLGFTWTTADDGGDYIQKLAGRYKISDKVERELSHDARRTMVAPNPPASGGASIQSRTPGVLPNIVRTISLCTPIPLP